jgi:predicted outer membrane lipoprotein
MKQDMYACYDLKRKIFNTKQGNLPVTEYFGVLNALWTELDQYQNLKMECSKDTVILNFVLERDIIFDFLAVLNVECDPIRVQILGKVKLSTLTKVFYTVRCEETRRHAMLSDHPPYELALIVAKVPQLSSPIFYCEYCRKP